MQQKTITVVIDQNGNSSVDVEGFAGQGCDKVLKDFQGDDRAKAQRKKAAFYTKTGDSRESHIFPEQPEDRHRIARG
jgi:hypothetical protein